ncbi:MAG TPA: glycosyltransferase family 2 protein [Myxococcales bacterium]|nr:glycosyltransferase family 2 protein [Myxococcales bacterium]
MSASQTSAARARVISLPLAPGSGIGDDPSPSPASAVTGASPHMYLAVFGVWLLALAWFHPRLASLLGMAGGPLGWAALAFFIGFTELAWLYGLFNIGVLVFAVIYRRQQRRTEAMPGIAAGKAPPVALLYTTCNDFVEKSALSCVNQDYPSFTVYILDDSSNPAFRTEVDRFAGRHPGRVLVVRRPDRRGFKAGNINHALRNVAREPLFALADADEILPPDFLARLAPRLTADPGCGFVQASHRYNPDAPSAFSASLGAGIDSHWRWYQPLRNRYGFVMLLGHGALLRRAAWEIVGGFPEIVSEDLAFALRIREHGFRGHFAEDVVCQEDFPETMRAFRIRHMKWTRGTCEFLFREMGRALRSRRIPLVEKLDVLFPTLNLPLSLLYFLFILDANVVLPALFGEARAMTLVAGGARLTVPFTLLDARFLPVMTPDFYAITLLTLLAPVLCFILDMWRTPLRLLKFLGHSTAAYGTLGPLSSIGVLLYLVTGKAVFHVTADRGDGRSIATSDSALARLRAAASRLFAGSHPDHLAVQGLEILCGVAFAVICLQTFQISFMGLSLGFILLPVLHHKRWENPLLRMLVHVPFAFILLGIALGGLSLLGLSTVLFGYGFHF